MAGIDLHLVAKPLDRLINDVTNLKDDMTVVIARLDRVDANTRGTVDRIDLTCRGLLDEIRAMHRRTDRLSRRVDRLDSEQEEKRAHERRGPERGRPAPRCAGAVAGVRPVRASGLRR